MSIVEILHASAYATAIRESEWMYPTLQVVHILGFSLLVGSIALFDLRVLGLGKSLPVAPIARFVLPAAWTGFALVVFAGVNMALSFIDVFAVNGVLGLKLLVIALAGVNALLFHRRFDGHLQSWDAGAAIQRGARVAAGVSLGMWATVITLGKLLAYIGGKD